ncbi:hypothetical protein BJ970_004771 [Saccharopolyspora phatthalungensis]|uniref:DDE Tnp4 domain-containing protein n=1 Tax=Saccharopolyspora phatthalungensis TaxID=664693 RepID=A0A840QBB7_9PSEU|nr:hypothetical protein [Saccharopolyspora phatthalungensis]
MFGDLGYEREADTVTVAFKKPKGGELADEQRDHNKVHNSKPAIAKRGNSLLKTTFKALRNISLPLENRYDRRRSPRPPADRPRPHHVITPATTHYSERLSVQALADRNWHSICVPGLTR